MNTNEEYKKYIVAFLDILGFKSTVNTEKFEDIRKIFLSIMSKDELVNYLSRAAESEDDSLCRYNNALGNTTIRVMSDSIVVATPVEEPEALAVVIDICYVVQKKLYELTPPVFLRGAIAEDELFLDENMIFGKALVNAYVAQENYAVYPRIIVEDKIIKDKCVSVAGETLPKDKDAYCYINSLEKYIGDCETTKQLENNKRYKKIKDHTTNMLGEYRDGHIRDKYIWVEKELKRLYANCALKEGTLCI